MIETEIVIVDSVVSYKHTILYIIFATFFQDFKGQVAKKNRLFPLLKYLAKNFLIIKL